MSNNAIGGAFNRANDDEIQNILDLTTKSDIGKINQVKKNPKYILKDLDRYLKNRINDFDAIVDIKFVMNCSFMARNVGGLYNNRKNLFALQRHVKALLSEYYTNVRQAKKKCQHWYTSIKDLKADKSDACIERFIQYQNDKIDYLMLKAQLKSIEAIYKSLIGITKDQKTSKKKSKKHQKKEVLEIPTEVEAA